MGRPGPDQGYAYTLARQFADRLRIPHGEHAEDAVSGCTAVALRRASMFGRAPTVYDLELAFGLFGYLDDAASAPADLVAWRQPVFSGASHDYWDQRAIVDGVPEATLRMTPAEVRAGLPRWRQLVGAG
jgi:hypothetical protein